MKITNYSAPEYQPIEILAQVAADGFDEVSYLEAHVSEPQQRLRQVSRELAAHTRQEAGAAGAMLSEPELVQVIELIAGSLAFGNSPWLPFGKPDRNKFFKLVGVAEDRLVAWEQVLRVMPTVAFKQLELKDFLLFEPRAEELLRTVRRIRVATQLSSRSSEIARFASTNFLAFCASDGAAVEPDEYGVLHRLMEQLLFRLSLSLQQQNELEIHLNLCTFWAEQVVPRYECSLQEWQFLLASLELGVHQMAGAQCSRVLTPYFLTLHQAVTRFAFCGVFFRHAEEMETKLAQALSEVRLDWRSFVRTVFGEILLEEGHPNAVSPVTWLVLNSHLFRGQEVAAFERAAAALVNLCRPLAERSWLDWLTDGLAKVVKAMRYLTDRRAADGMLKNVVDFATENLKQGLEIFYSTPQFGKELTLVMDTAQVLALVHPSFQHAKSAYRTWFITIFGTDAGTGVWQHAKTIAGAVQTSIKYQAGASDFFANYPSLGELLETVPEFTAEARFPFQALGKVDSDLVENCPGNPANQAVLLRTVRQALLNLARHGTRRAPAVTLGWLLEEVFPSDTQTRFDDWEVLFLSLRDEALMYRELQDEAVFEIMTRITEEAPAVVLSERLWGVSDALASAIAPRVYAALPEYQALTKETGLEKCARDNGTVLRRAALALELPFEDRSGFFENWWANLINSYIVNRPPRLFEITRQVIYQVVRDHFGETATELVDAVIGPAYGSALTSEPAAGEKPPLLPLPVRFPGLAELHTRADVAGPAGGGFDWAMFLSTGMETAFHYATGTNAHLPKLLLNVPGSQAIPLVKPTGDEVEYLQQNLNYLCSLLAEGFLPFEWCGFVAQETVTGWGHLLENLPPTGFKIERFLIGLIYHTGTVTDGITKLRLIDYLQALIELNRQWLAGYELHQQADALSQAVAAHLHRNFPEMAAKGVTAASPEKCSRDLAHVYRALAAGLKKLPKPAARLHVHRFLLEAVSPFINYGEDMWRKTWRASWFHGEEVFSALVHRELKTWFTALEKTGSTMPALGPLMRKFACEPDPIFSPAPDEELEWRRTVGTLLALVQAQSCTPSDAAVLRWVLTESLPLAAAPDFTSKLRMILDSLRNWFIDLDLSLVEAEFKAFEKASQEVQLVKKLMPQLEPIRLKLAERIPAVQQLGSPQQVNRLVLFLTKDRLGAAPEGTRWMVPRLLKAVDSRLLAQLAALPPGEMDRLQAGLSNLLAPHLGSAEFVGELLPLLKRLAQSEKDFQQAWNRQWILEGKEFSDASCQRDMQWMARRICLDGWLGQAVSLGAVSWYVAEVIPQAGTIPPKTYLRAIKLLVDQFQASNFLVPEMKNAAAEFQQAMTPILQNPKKIDPETLEDVVEDKKSLWGVITGKLMRLGQD